MSSDAINPLYAAALHKLEAGAQAEASGNPRLALALYGEGANLFRQTLMDEPNDFVKTSMRLRLSPHEARFAALAARCAPPAGGPAGVPARAGGADEIYLLGSWRLTSFEHRRHGKAFLPMGAAPVGRIIYTGRSVSVLLGWGARAPWASPDPAAASEAERAEAARTLKAHTGRFTVDSHAKVVTHAADLSLVPNRSGTEYRFGYLLQPRASARRCDVLVLTPVGGAGADGEFLTWEKEDQA